MITQGYFGSLDKIRLIGERWNFPPHLLGESPRAGTQLLLPIRASKELVIAFLGFSKYLCKGKNIGSFLRLQWSA